ncbi:MAG: methionyl-tRNA formyltransferase [Dehalococcoidia bacterium]|nr:methionyl-tRNA formyltransferase [Dehalococcoidia bacterium]MDW8120541.1 methionyl-tRNA formyltransferase [Chloroflexota bacterium]
MRLVFMGTPAFVIPVLETLAEAGHEVVGVVTPPDKPAGRGQRTEPSPVKVWAVERGLPVFQPPTLRRAEAQETLRRLAPQVIIVAAYGKLLPPEVLAIPPLGCLNLHPSLLPKYRGPSPVATAILNGDAVTGITLMLLDPGMDTGPILAQVEEPIRDEDTTRTLTERLFRRGASLLVQTLERWARGEISPRPQDPTQASTTRLLTKEDGWLDFTQSAVQLWRAVRAYDPWPGTFTRWKGQVLKVLEARPWPQDTAHPPGTVVALPTHAPAPVGLQTGQGVLALLRLHLEGKRPMGWREFLAGYRDFIGSRLPS